MHLGSARLLRRVSFVILFRILGGDPNIEGLADFNGDGNLV